MYITPLPHACQSSAVSAYINTLLCPTQKKIRFKCILCYLFFCAIKFVLLATLISFSKPAVSLQFYLYENPSQVEA